MYKIIYVDGRYMAHIGRDGKPNKYDLPKEFKTKKDAQAWIDKQSYRGMSYRYEVVLIRKTLDRD